MLEEELSTPAVELGCSFRLPSDPKTFQNRRLIHRIRREIMVLSQTYVSSAAPEQTVLPSGEVARCSTREVCPLSSLTLTMLGYFHRQSWFSA